MISPTRFLFLTSAVVSVVLTNPASGQIVALDNTSGGTASLMGGNQLYEDSSFRKGFVFTAPSDAPVRLTGLRFGFQESSTGSTLNLVVELHAVNGANNPTGSALASLTTSTTISTTSYYYAYDLTTNPRSTFDDFNLSAGQTYAVVAYSVGSGGLAGPLWNVTRPSATPTASNGFAVVGYRASFDSGSSWGTSSTYNSIEISYAAVPEPTAYATFAAAGVLGFALYRRRRSA